MSVHDSEAERADPRAAFAAEMPPFGPDTEIYGPGEGQDILESLLGDEPAVDGEEEVAARLRGRPALSPAAERGTKAPQLTFRLRLDQRAKLTEAIRRGQGKNDSDVLRHALDEYFENHKISA